MRKVTLNIPENKFEFFLQIMKELKIPVEANEEDYTISDEEQKLMIARMNKATPSDYKPWDKSKLYYKS